MYEKADIKQKQTKNKAKTKQKYWLKMNFFFSKAH